MALARSHVSNVKGVLWTVVREPPPTLKLRGTRGRGGGRRQGRLWGMSPEPAQWASIRMKERFDAELAALPRGSLVRRKIKGHAYYYLVSREGGKVRSVYKGKVMPAGELRRYQQAKERRAKVRRSLSQLKKQIRYLKGALRGKEEF